MQQPSRIAAKDVFEKALSYTKADEFRRVGLYPYFTEFSGAVDTGEAEVMMGDRRVLMFGSNNYLGLTTRPEVKAAAIEAVNQYGTGCSGSRMLNGTMGLHVRLEEALARFMKREAALAFGTGFQTNLGALSTLAQKGDVIIADRNIHASLLDGCLASFARTMRYRHNDMRDLAKVLESLPPDEGRLIVVDGVFSMEGDTANLPEIVRLARQHGARVYVDEAHSIGVLGTTGRGAAEHYAVEGDVDVVMGTFSKSFASIGGFIAARREVIEFIKHHSRAFVYSASLAPANAAAVLKAIEIIEREPELRTRLLNTSAKLKRELKAMGYRLLEPHESFTGVTPIIPVVVDDEVLVCRFFWELMSEGIYTNPVLAPAVAHSLIRISCMATHNDEHVERLLEAMHRIGRRMEIIQ
ncbi:MAG TPA: aminotransferase class I/II-fold pyridoxal phosphate-dependent enzyme [Blastocatellia bacterium]|nr:aminotransferase class I/II-fold pyridoxal phosphate-dependent enzyme [Blastocatellia bacterium]